MAETIASIQARLRAMVTDWKEDGSHPCNYVRENGMGDELARVDRWCGGYQDVHEPVIIGWRARVGNQLCQSVVLVDYANEVTKVAAITTAINKAKVAATKALAELVEGR